MHEVEIEKNTPTFKKDGYRRVKCPKCGHVLGNAKTGQFKKTIFGATRTMELKCIFCGFKFKVDPPRRGFKDGQSGIYWGIKEDMSSTFTPDQNLTEE